MDALIGHSGFVGSTLLKQRSFEQRYRSTNIGDIDGQSFETVVCAGAPAQKWIANKDPQTDLKIIEDLIGHLRTVKCGTFVLISTVDVFKKAVGVDENSVVDEVGLHAYGLHRRLLEKAVAEQFPRHLIVRLPGLVGPGLRKNVIFDLLNDNNLHAIDSRARFQFYPMVNLWYDIQTALDARFSLVHLTAAPVTVAQIAQDGFGRRFDEQLESGAPAAYDMRSRHAGLFGSHDSYQYSDRETIQAVRTYAQSEPRTLDASAAKT